MVLLKFFRFLSALALIVLFALPASAVVEVARSGQSPVTIHDVYLRDGFSYVAIEEVLAALGMKGTWDPVRHVYRFNTPSGAAVISPGSPYLRLERRFIPLEAPPRFIDGSLRVTEEMITSQIPSLLREPIYYRNLHPHVGPSSADESPLDRLFSFLLRRKMPEAAGPALRGIVVDPGHGGQDPGVMTADGVTEKTVVLQVARRLERLVKMRLGAPVYLTRDGDYALSPEQRLAAAARPDVDALILLHAQGALSSEPRGVTLFVRAQEEGEQGEVIRGEGASMRLARHLVESLRTRGVEVVGIQRISSPLLGRGDLPTVLVELGFLSNTEDRLRLTDPSGQDGLAEALFAGLKNFAEQERKEIL